MKRSVMRWEPLYEPHLQPCVFWARPKVNDWTWGEKTERKKITKERKISKKPPSAAGELWLPVWGNLLALCGCESAMLAWCSRPPPPLTRHPWRQQETLQRGQLHEKEGKKSVNKEMEINGRCKLPIRNDKRKLEEEQSKKKKKIKAWKKKETRKTTNTWEQMNDKAWQTMYNTTRGLHTTPHSGKTAKGLCRHTEYSLRHTHTHT